MTISFLNRTGLVLAAALVATSAHAMPMLRGDVTVHSSLVTLGDLFENVGLAAEKAVFRAPAPGTTGEVSIEDIAAAVRTAGIEDFETADLRAIKVTRDGVAVDMPLLSTLIADDLRLRGILRDDMDMGLSLDGPLPDLVAADTADPAQLEMLRYMPGSSTFAARFTISGTSQLLDVSGQIELQIATPHLTRSLPEGTIIGPDDIEMRMVPLAYAETAGIVAADTVVGKQLQRQTRAGVMLRPDDLAEPQIIGRNDTVTVVYREGALTLTATGKALNGASMSQPVSVLNTMTNKVLQGTASSDGTVTIGSRPQQLAGL